MKLLFTQKKSPPKLKKLHILLGHKSGGILNVYKTLLPRITEFFEVTVLTLDCPEGIDVFPGYKKINLDVKTPLTGIRILHFLLNFVRYRVKNKDSSIIINNPSTSILVYLASLFSEFIYFVHVHEPLDAIIFSKKKMFQSIYVYFLKKSFSEAKAVVCISKHTQGSVQKILDIKNSTIIYNPICVKEIIEYSEADIYPLLNKNTYNFVTVGRLTKAKGYDVLLNAVNLLKYTCSMNFKVYIIGDGEEYDELSSKIKAFDLNDIVYLTGFRSNPFPFIRSCDCYLSTSLWEGLGLTIIYAMLLKKNIIAARTGGALELLDEQNAFFEIGNSLELSEKMKNYLGNDILNRSVVENNFQTSLKFDIENIYLDFVKEFTN